MEQPPSIVPPAAAQARIAVIRRSLECFVCGLFGFIPFLGVMPGLYALVCGVVVWSRYPREWNPAAAYLTCGIVLSLAGLLGTVLGLGVIVVAAFG
jgi:hypothetical protein